MEILVAMNMFKTLNNQTVEWKDLNWRKLERVTFKLQKRIYQASERGDAKAVRKLQKTLIRSWSAKCLAVRRVTQENQGKNTAGVDGVKTLTSKQRTTLVNRLKLTGKAKPTRRVMIPKPGSNEKRPLRIPTIDDRALQALVKIALEPEWEAKFEPNSYGFRPGRSCHDAISCYAAKSDKIALPLFLTFLSHLITIFPSFNNLCSNSDNSSTDLNSRCAIYSFAECQTNSIKL
jgi:RNA-directed DNA polymerase